MMISRKTMESSSAKSVPYTSSATWPAPATHMTFSRMMPEMTWLEQGNYNFCLVGDSGRATSRGRVAAGTIGEIHAASEPRWWR